MWLKSDNRKVAEEELQRLQFQMSKNEDKSVGVKDLFRDRATFRGFIIAIGILSCIPTCGLFPVVRIFDLTVNEGD